MQIDVLLERVEGNGYRATTYSPFPASADAPTSEEALSSLREVVRRKIASGANVVKLEVGAGEHPLKKFAGVFKDDPYFEDFLKGVEEYRRVRDGERNEVANDAEAG